MSERPDAAGDKDPLAEDATDASREGWERYTDRAEEDQGNGDEEPDGGVSMFPDVQLLADSLTASSEELAGDDEDDGTRNGGAP